MGTFLARKPYCTYTASAQSYTALFFSALFPLLFEHALLKLKYETVVIGTQQPVELKKVVDSALKNSLQQRL
ncbi:hypothetical protein LC087_14825 [Bacillus carboniphilus]|uniref:Uncharacterized protein n=1 Tax=Bacillus carboniphilus TaxID=86663 RepID=A0ABY9JTG2_9BACI|nr:hypothetical protein [Bacillus carboniphilus]WLR42038.1 hypothetical protein LC087_14825 [Bacillus carboniphilus]